MGLVAAGEGAGRRPGREDPRGAQILAKGNVTSGKEGRIWGWRQELRCPHLRGQCYPAVHPDVAELPSKEDPRLSSRCPSQHILSPAMLDETGFSGMCGGRRVHWDSN